MIAVVLACLLAGPAPTVLTTPDPAQLVRWPALKLQDEPGNKGAAARFRAVGPTVVRFQSEGRPCAARVSRLATADNATLALPLAPSPNGVTVIPPQVAAPAAPGTDEAQAVELDYRVERSSSCAAGPLRAYRAQLEHDGFGLIAAEREIDALLASPPPTQEALGWLSAQFPHQWQESAALLAVLSPWLGEQARRDQPLRAALQVLRDQVSGIRGAALEFSFITDLQLPIPQKNLGPDGETFFLLPAGKSVEVDVQGKTALHLVQRAALAPSESAGASWRLLLARDGTGPEAIVSASPMDPLTPGHTRQRTEVLLLPPNARTLRLTAVDREVALRGLAVRAKHSIEEALSLRSKEPPPRRTTDGMPDHLREIVIATTAPANREDPIQARTWLSQWTRPEWKPLARIFTARLARAKAQARLLDGDFSGARQALGEVVTADCLRDEDAVLLAKLDIAAGDATRVGLGALEIIDHLLVLRPLDQALQSARALAFSAYSRWRPLSPVGETREVAFLIEQPPSPSGSRPSRTAFLRLTEQQAVPVLLPTPAGLDRHPVLTLLAMAPAHPGAATLVLDGNRRLSLPLRLPFERFDLPLPAGAHTVVLESAPKDARVLVNQAPTASSTAHLRTMVPLLPEGQAFLRREVGQPGIAQLAVRAVGNGPWPAELSLRLEGNGAPLVLPWRPGPAVPRDMAQLPPRSKASAELELTLPLRSGAHTLRLSCTGAPGLQIFVSMGERQRRLLHPDVPTPATSGKAAPVVERTSVLRELGENILAREVLLQALSSPGMSRSEGTHLEQIWRDLDESSGPHPATAKPGAVLSPWLLLASDSDLSTLAAARAAEIAGKEASAARHWLALAERHPHQALLRREAGRALLQGPEADPARAYVELVAAQEGDPHPDWARVLLRKAKARTRVRFLPYAEDSAGVMRVRMAQSDFFDDSVSAMFLASKKNASAANLLSQDREANLTFTLSSPAHVSLRVSPQELRVAQARVHAPPMALEWILDGAAPQTLPCDAGVSCTSPALALGTGHHTLKAHLLGGLRPLARLWVLSDRPMADAPAMGRGFAIPIEFITEYLVASADQPVRMTLQGPTVLRLDARVSSTDRATRLRVSESGNRHREREAEGAAAEIELPRKSDGTASLLDGGALSAGTVSLLPLHQKRLYHVVIRPDKGSALLRLSVRDNDEAVLPSPPLPVSYPTAKEEPRVQVADLEAGIAATVVDPPVALGWDHVGTLNATVGAQRIRENSEGESVQRTDQESLLLTYRQALEPLHTTLRAQGVLRRRSQGSLSETLGFRAFFMHREFRPLRALLAVQGHMQEVAGRQEYGRTFDAMLEPVATLVSGLHLVTKLGYHNVRQSLIAPNAALLPSIDPNVYNRYDDKHWQAGFVEMGLETEPFVNLVVYANARLTSNADLLSRTPDHATSSLMTRVLWNRLYLEATYRFGRYFADLDRSTATSRNTVFLNGFYSLWPSLRQRLDAGLSLSWQFETHVPQAAVFLSWEFSNGRRLRDHTSVEGEDYFFPQRGPGREPGGIQGALP